MTKQEKEIRKDIRFEISARKALLKRLSSPCIHAKAAAEKKKKVREESWRKAQEYGNYEEAQEAYGCGMITQEEFWAITDILEEGEAKILQAISTEERAAEILSEFVSEIKRQIQSLEWDLLSEKEKAEISRSNEEILNRRNSRKENCDF